MGAPASGGRRPAPEARALPDDPRARALAERLAAVTLRDEDRLRRRLAALARRPAEAFAADLDQLEVLTTAAEARTARRAASVPALEYPEQLPVSQAKDDIARALAEHQVIVVAGETGSGKTTQLPKIALEVGRGVRGRIGHTQPRRIAARAVAERVAEELHTELGGTVGYAVRFTDTVGEDSLVKVMTDGILLAEIQRDPELLQYDTLIVDEAHERSLTIDFLLGYLAQLLPRRPDLKLVITSRPSTRSGSPGTSAGLPSWRSRGARTPSRSGTGRCWPRNWPRNSSATSARGGRRFPRRPRRPDRPRRRRPRPDRGHPRRRAGTGGGGPGTSSCSCRGNGRSATPPTPSPTS